MINNILRRPPWRSSALSIAVGLALSACAVGPDFHAPDAPKVADASHPYTAAPLPAMPASADCTSALSAGDWKASHHVAEMSWPSTKCCGT